MPRIDIRWQDGPIGPGWLLMLARRVVVPLPGGGGAGFVKGTYPRGPVVPERRKKKTPEHARDAELLALLMLTED